MFTKATCRFFAAALFLLSGLQLLAQTKDDSLTLDGTTTLTVGPAGAHKDSTLVVNTLTLSGGKIVTNGNTLRIKATRVVSRGGLIVSFLYKDMTPPDAPDGQRGAPGLDAGTVEIEAASLEGTLKIVLRGQNGGRGGRGQAGVSGVAGRRGDDAADHLFDCAHGGGNGSPGTDGTPGGRGLQGGAAGNGGTLTLKGSLKTGNVGIDFDSPPGSPGMGGPGGKGGNGGPGGQGGSGSVHCGGGSSGPAGHDAPDGLVGESGAEGSKGKIQ